MNLLLSKARDSVQDRARIIRSRLPSTTGIHFMTFANTQYMEPTRILKEAEGFRFATAESMNEHDISEFVERHRTFIKDHATGYGLWIWKPKVILERLSRMKDNDILVYCDAGMHLNRGGLLRYYDYLNILNQKDIVTFSLNDNYKAQHYVKRDAINAYYPEFANDVTQYCYAGVMMLKKTDKTMNLLTDWLGLCENYHFIDKSDSIAPELPIYQGNDCDNGLFNLCLAKHRISHAIYPDETNIYASDGYQFQNSLPEHWRYIETLPFQCRRLRTAR